MFTFFYKVQLNVTFLSKIRDNINTILTNPILFTIYKSILLLLLLNKVPGIRYGGNKQDVGSHIL